MENKINSGNFFEDFFVGQELNHSTPRTISPGDISLFIGLLGSRFVLHGSDVSLLSQKVSEDFSNLRKGIQGNNKDTGPDKPY